MKEQVEKLRKLLGFPTDPSLAKAIGISTRSLYYAWHDAQYSAKTAAKIEAAMERASGLTRPNDQVLQVRLPIPGESAPRAVQALDKDELRRQIALLEEALRIARNLLEEK